LPFFTVAWEAGCLVAQVRRDEVFALMGKLRGGIPEPPFTTTMRPQRKAFTEFWWFVSGKGNVINSTNCVYNYGRRRQVKAIPSVVYLVPKFKLKSETLWSTNSEFIVFPVRLWNLINISRYFSINILIWNINFCYGGGIKFCKIIRQRFFLTPMNKKEWFVSAVASLDCSTKNQLPLRVLK